MVLEIDVDGRIRTVTIERATPGHGRFRVTLDGRMHLLDVHRVDDTTLSLIFVEADGASHEVAVVETGRAGQLDVQLHGTVVRTTLNGRRLAAGTPGASANASGAQRIVAPMPGKVVRVLVAAGDEVVERQELVVVEAMKMENALGSPKTGRVTEVAVREGMTVEVGRVLIAVE